MKAGNVPNSANFFLDIEQVNHHAWERARRSTCMLL